MYTGARACRSFAIFEWSVLGRKFWVAGAKCERQTRSPSKPPSRSPSPYCPPSCSSAGRAGAGCAAARTQRLALGSRAPQPRPHGTRASHATVEETRPRALLAPQRRIY
eukprot:scaffold5401_cov75-Phaeocystis_antarctica.AAC.2